MQSPRLGHHPDLHRHPTQHSPIDESTSPWDGAGSLVQQGRWLLDRPLLIFSSCYSLLGCCLGQGHDRSCHYTIILSGMWREGLSWWRVEGFAYDQESFSPPQQLVLVLLGQLNDKRGKRLLPMVWYNLQLKHQSRGRDIFGGWGNDLYGWDKSPRPPNVGSVWAAREVDFWGQCHWLSHSRG